MNSDTTPPKIPTVAEILKASKLALYPVINLEDYREIPDLSHITIKTLVIKNYANNNSAYWPRATKLSILEAGNALACPDLSHKNITELDLRSIDVPDITKLPLNLEILTAWYNSQILPDLSQTNIHTLNLYWCSVDIIQANLPAQLKILSLCHTVHATIDIAKTKIKELSLYNVKLPASINAELLPETLEKVCITACTISKYMDLSHTQLHTLKLRDIDTYSMPRLPATIRCITIEYTYISNILDLSNVPIHKLEILELHPNISLESRHLPQSLKHLKLKCADMQLGDLADSNIETMDINVIEHAPGEIQDPLLNWQLLPRNLIKLQLRLPKSFPDLSHTSITYLDMRTIGRIKYLDAKLLPPALEVLILHHIYTLPDLSHTRIRALHVKNHCTDTCLCNGYIFASLNSRKDVELCLPPTIEDFVLNHYYLDALPKLSGEKFKNLKKLDLSHNNLSKENGRNFCHWPPHLKELNLHKCGLHKLPGLAALTHCEKISADIDFFNNEEKMPPNLTDLNVYGAKLKNIIIPQNYLPNLTNLNAGKTNITTIDIHCDNLLTLTLDHAKINHIYNLPGSIANLNMRDVSLNSMKYIRSIPINTNINDIYIDRNLIWMGKYNKIIYALLKESSWDGKILPADIIDLLCEFYLCPTFIPPRRPIARIQI